MQCIVGIVLAGRALVSYWLQITNGSFAISLELLSEGRRQEVGPRRGEEEGGHPGPRVVFVKVSGLWTENSGKLKPGQICLMFASAHNQLIVVIILARQLFGAHIMLITTIITLLPTFSSDGTSI